MSLSLPEITLRPGKRARALRGHPWVFAGEVEEPLPEGLDGAAVTCRDARGRFLGTGIFNRRSQIVWRRFSRTDQGFERTYLAEAMDRAIGRRPEEACRRLVWSEADDLPGLIVDQFGDILVVQATTMAVDLRIDGVVAYLEERFKPRAIVLRNDAPSRQHEGLEREQRIATGRVESPEWVEIDGIAYPLDFTGGQKTGFFLDQRQQHREVAALAKGRRMLDAFCHVGGFSLQAARAGAAEVLGLDLSEPSIRAADAAAERAGLSTAFEMANVFDWLSAHEGDPFDLIVLDPPSFARNRGAVEGALRGYKEINLRAMKHLSPGGILATYSCSQHIDVSTFEGVVAEAANDVRRSVRILQRTGQPIDHPVRLDFPESSYLKGLILAVE